MRSTNHLACVGLLALCNCAVALDKPVTAGTNDIYVVPFSHLDLMWGGTREECLSRGNRIITKAIQLAEQHPEFRFLIEDEVFAANYMDAHRGARELDELKNLVKEGRIQVAPKWAAIYQNMPRAEALARNLIYGKEYAREVFQVDPQVANLTDIPGFTWQYPQLLTKADIPWMVMTRMGPPDCSLFNWKSPDGSSVLVWNTIRGYGWGIGLGLHRPSLDDKEVAHIAKDIGQIQSTTTGPIYLEWGTDLWSPTENLVTNVSFLNQRLAPMKFGFATPDEFFHLASQEKGVPEFSGEVPSSWVNLITSLTHLWLPGMTAADTLVTAEKFSAINYALGYADYPQKEFELLWKDVLEVMDHNNFGQGGEIGDNRKLEFAATATMRGNEILREMLRNIAERVQRPFARSTPIVVFNPLNWNRDDVVEAHVSVYGDVNPGDIRDYRKAMQLVDETGTPVPFHVEQVSDVTSTAYEIAFVARGVPSLGYKTYFLVPAEKSAAFTNFCDVKMSNADDMKPKKVFGTNVVENEFYRVTVDQGTGRITVFDKELNQTVARDMEIVGVEERGGNTLSLEPYTGRTVVNSINEVALEENDPVRTELRVSGNLGGVSVTQKLFLYRGLKRIDLENTVDWKQNSFIKIEQLFPYEHASALVRYGIPYGSAASTDLLPDSGPHSGDEVVRSEWLQWRQIQDWIFAGTPEWGMTIGADHQLMILGDGVIRSAMLRGAYSSTSITRGGKPFLQQEPPPGKYIFRYTLASGKGDWAAARSYRTGIAFDTPLVPVVVEDELTTKSLPPTKSFCSLQADDLVITALKKAERADAIVLRAVEMDGSPAETPVEFLGHDSSFSPVNLLEESPRGAVEQQTLKLKPYEISTVRLIAK